MLSFSLLKKITITLIKACNGSVSLCRWASEQEKRRRRRKEGAFIYSLNGAPKRASCGFLRFHRVYPSFTQPHCAFWRNKVVNFHFWPRQRAAQRSSARFSPHQSRLTLLRTGGEERVTARGKKQNCILWLWNHKINHMWSTKLSHTRQSIKSLTQSVFRWS